MKSIRTSKWRKAIVVGALPLALGALTAACADDDPDTEVNVDDEDGVTDEDTVVDEETVVDEDTETETETEEATETSS